MRSLPRHAWLDWPLLLLAVAFTAVSALYSWKVGNWNWFARSGSVMVLIGAILEYRNGEFLRGYNEAFTFRRDEQGVLLSQSTTLTRLYTRAIAHVLVIAGTLIWGFGDLTDRLLNFCF